MCDNSNNYFYINTCDNSEKIWINSFRGNIVKSVYNPKTNKITQYSMPYNRINEYIKFFNQEATYKKNGNNEKNNNNFSCKIVNRNLELLNKFD